MDLIFVSIFYCTCSVSPAKALYGKVTKGGCILIKRSSSPAVSSGLDSLLDKDWRGRGFDQDVDQLIKFIQSDRSTRRPSQVRRLPPSVFCTSSTPYSFPHFLASFSSILVPPTLKAKGEESFLRSRSFNVMFKNSCRRGFGGRRRQPVHLSSDLFTLLLPPVGIY